MRLRGNQLLRQIDASVGRLLILVWALFRRKRDLPKKINSIGLLKLSGIGDLVLLSGIIQDLRRAYPSVRLSLFCGADNAALSELMPALDEVFVVPLQAPFKALALLKKHRLDVLIDFGQWSRIDPLLASRSGASYVIGFKTKGQQRHYLYDATQPHRSNTHEIENFRSLVAELGLVSSSLPLLQLKGGCSFPKGYVLFHPWPSGIRSYLKEWPEESWIQLGEILAARGLTLLMSGGKNDRDRSQKLVNEINRVAKRGAAQNIAGKYSLNELGHCICGATAVVSVNTGIMHMAACFPTPLVALHGPTSSLRWGPLGSCAVALTSSDVSCGYLNLGFEYPQNPPRCMEQIPVDQVVKALDFLLSRQSPSF